VDTDPHKWQARLKMPALCDFRDARISFGFSGSAPGPFTLPNDFIQTASVTDAETGDDLGTMYSIACREWNAGRYPIAPGEHKCIPILPKAVTIDNGHGTQMPVELTVGLIVEQHLYYGQFPILRLSGFRDEIKGADEVITNACEFGLLSPEEIQKWRRLGDESEAPVKPVIRLQALYAWGDGQDDGVE
jgi:hypothetical protein